MAAGASARVRRVAAALAATAAFTASPASADRPDFPTPPAPAASEPAADPREADRASELKALQSADLGLAQLPAAQAYLDALLRRIQAAGPQPPVPARVLIRPRLSYNAASTGLGHIVVDLGWLKSIDGEPELAALLAHEYAHVRLAHLGTKNAVGTASHWALMAAAVAARGGNLLGRSLANESWVSLLRPSWSRGQELEADAFALDTTQALGYAFVPGVRAFLDRIRSVEQRAAQPAAPSTALADDHPSIAERLDAVQQLAAGKPRQRPSAKGPDPWRAVRDGAAFRREEAEILLVAKALDAFAANRPEALADALRPLARLAEPRTAAGTTLKALTLAPQDVDAKLALLDRAIAAPDASFVAYQLKAQLQRDALGQHEAGVATLRAGLERFDSPGMHFPAVIQFEREVKDAIDALPQGQRSLGLSLFGLKLAATTIGLNLRCRAEPEFADACAWAALNAQEREAQLQRQRQAQADVERKVQQKLDKMFK